MPFQAIPMDGDNARRQPRVIETRLIGKLRRLAQAIADGKETPRIIFLVGGPGNGKSEAVQDFLTSLGRALGCEDRLCSLLTTEFAPNPIIRWSVEITAGEVQDTGFSRFVDRLVVIQDASSSEDPCKDAASGLAGLIGELITAPGPQPLVVCCVNRGLLVRSLRWAHQNGQPSDAIDLLRDLIRATSLGSEAFSEKRPKCWPLETSVPCLAGRVCCWPMDMESLLLPTEAEGASESPIEQVILEAVHSDRWSGECESCSARPMCPFHQNAAWLRNGSRRTALLQILRDAEFATNQRWSFRDALALVAEILIGETVDFGDSIHPCDWVAARTAVLGLDRGSRCASLYELVARLYPNALFPVPVLGRSQELLERSDEAVTLDAKARVHDMWPSIHIRQVLFNRLTPKLDPAFLSPGDRTHPLAKIEDAYSQSVITGNEAWPAEAPMSASEQALLMEVGQIEEEIDPMEPNSAQTFETKRYFRVLGSTLAKRSVGVRLGSHYNEEYLGEYRSALRDEYKLTDLTDSLRSLLGGEQFAFNALESFGQPQASQVSLVSLESASVDMSRIASAPSSFEHTPAHDLPSLRVGSHVVALTFDLFMALRQRAKGCIDVNLPASVRAAIDRIRHLMAGRLCRRTDLFLQQNVKYRVHNHGLITTTPDGTQAWFRPRSDHYGT